jgi:hypothetical protein
LDPEDDDEMTGEAQVSIEPRRQALADLGIAPAEFHKALLVALEERDDFAARNELEDDEMPPLGELSLQIRSVHYKLEDLADVELRDGAA